MAVVTPASNKSLEWFVSKVIPSYIIENFSGTPGAPSLPLFVQKFFEFLNHNYIDTVRDESGNILSQTITCQGAYLIIQNLISYADIDQTITGFLQHFKNEYADSFPFVGDFDDPQNSITTDIRRLIKHIRDFYLSKGSISSLKFFFMAAFGQEISLYFPTVDILRVSDGKWFQPVYLGAINLDNTALTDVQLANLPDRYIIGQTSLASGYIQKIDTVIIPNGVVDTALHNWISLATVKGTFLDGEQIKVYDSITNQVLYTLKLQDRGYSTLDGTYPARPYHYKGLWENGFHYKTGDVVAVLASQFSVPPAAWNHSTSYTVGNQVTVSGSPYIWQCTANVGPVGTTVTPPTDLSHWTKIVFWVAKEEFTSLTQPQWQVGFYSHASIVVYSGQVYQVKNNRQTWKGAVSPNLDANNWAPLGLISGTVTPNVWSASNTYTNGDIVQYNLGTFWVAYQLRYFRSQFVNNSNPSVDTINWNHLSSDSAANYTLIPPGTVYNWSGTALYNEDTFAADSAGVVFQPNSFRQNYMSNIPPSDSAVVNIAWVRIGSTTSGGSDPTWATNSTYNFGDVVKFNDATLGWGRYQLVKPLDSPFLSTTNPDNDSLYWSLAASNYQFDQETSYNSLKWKALPSPSINPELIGISDPGDFPGYWLNHDGWLDSEKKIQDSFFYQDFSYQVTCDLDQTAFRQPLINIAHPAGYQLFNVVSSVGNLPLYSLALGMPLPLYPPNSAKLDLRTPNYPNVIFTIEWMNDRSAFPFDISLADANTSRISSSVVSTYSLQTDYSTFQRYREANLVFEQDIVDNTDVVDFAILGGGNNVLVFNNGLKLPCVPKKEYVLSGNPRYILP